MRSAEAMELIAANGNAFTLAYIIGYRARYSDTFNRHQLARGEALLGDFKNYGMTEQEYRTAKEMLENHKFATFKTTNKGTIAKLTDSRLFDPLNISDNGQSNSRATGKQRTANGQPTTQQRLSIKNNKEEKKEKGKAGVKTPAPKAALPLAGAAAKAGVERFLE